MSAIFPLAICTLLTSSVDPSPPRINNIYAADTPMPRLDCMCGFLVRSRTIVVEIIGAQDNHTVQVYVNGSLMHTCKKNEFKSSDRSKEGLYRCTLHAKGWMPGCYKIHCVVIANQLSAQTDTEMMFFAPLPEKKDAKKMDGEGPLEAGGSPAYPFTAWPSVKSIAAGKDEACAADKALADKKDFDYRFRQPARFIYPVFSQVEGIFGERKAQDALVIYEGMRFAIDKTGRYEINFAASCPDTPATLRMTLQLHVPGCELIPITLPPIAINHEATAIGNYRGKTVHIRHCGYSHRFAELAEKNGALIMCLQHLAECGDCVVERDGTARFGTLPLGAE
ncbi:MAG: hypothetical protein L0215_21970 [Gemmataceae bacterium]|nr:hypothetical protein [Gemmataceae bacterium]